VVTDFHVKSGVSLQYTCGIIARVSLFQKSIEEERLIQTMNSAFGRYDVKSPNCRIYQALYPRVLRLEGLQLLRWAR
jgi:hypothetical protein